MLYAKMVIAFQPSRTASRIDHEIPISSATYGLHGPPRHNHVRTACMLGKTPPTRYRRTSFASSTKKRCPTKQRTEPPMHALNTHARTHHPPTPTQTTIPPPTTRAHTHIDTKA